MHEAPVVAPASVLAGCKLCYNSGAAGPTGRNRPQTKIALWPIAPHGAPVRVTFMSQILLLYRLQLIDSEIHQKRERLQEVMAAQIDSPEVIAGRRRAARAAAALKDERTSLKRSEAELAGVNDETRRNEERLYSGLVKNPKELGDLQQKIAALGRRSEALEEQVIEYMVRTEEAEAEATAAGSSLAALQAAWEANQAALRQEQATLEQALAEAGQRRAELAPRLSSPFLSQYEAVRRRRGVLAVAGLRDGVCQGCQVRVPATLVNQANNGELTHCNSCGRIIVPV